MNRFRSTESTGLRPLSFESADRVQRNSATGKRRVRAVQLTEDRWSSSRNSPLRFSAFMKRAIRHRGAKGSSATDGSIMLEEVRIDRVFEQRGVAGDDREPG